MKKLDLTKIDNITKILLILLIGVVFYFVVFLILNSFIIKEPRTMAEMMGQITGSNANSVIINLVSLIIAILVALIISFRLFRQDKQEHEYRIIRKALSNDEKAILDEIKKAGEITQDSLRFRLNWSKAKISTTLTNLDKMNLIQKERIGKTYKVYLQNEKK